MRKSNVNYKIFLPAIVLFVLCITVAFVNNQLFVDVTTRVYDAILEYFGWLFVLVAVICFVLCIVLYLSPFGNIVIGGKKATPQLSNWSWFTITLCTTIGSGIIFWGAAEPVQHMLYPPESLHLDPLSPDSALFAMSTIFKHWTLLPYALYTIVTVVFAFVYFNMQKEYSLGSTILPNKNFKRRDIICTVTDLICVFSLVTGLAASIYAAVLSLNGGISRLIEIPSNAVSWGIIIIVICSITMLSAISGINKGIKNLSNFNVAVYIVILAIILLFGGAKFICGFATESIGKFISTFFESALFTGEAAGDTWAKDWTMYYFANWLAWTPITGVFLGSICYGRKVKHVILMNLGLTSAFSIVWFAIISGATVNQLLNDPNANLIEAFNNGYENVIYQVFQNIHLDKILTPTFIVAVLISLITASDSTTYSISSLCSKGIAQNAAKPPKVIIVIWLVVIGFLTWIMMSFGEGITGIRILSNIGGFPSMILVILIIYTAIKFAIKGNVYNLVDKESCEQFKNTESRASHD